MYALGHQVWVWDIACRSAWAGISGTIFMAPNEKLKWFNTSGMDVDDRKSLTRFG